MKNLNIGGVYELKCVKTIIHEIRHQFQYNYTKDIYYSNNIMCKLKHVFLKYNNRIEEVDANKFAEDFMNSNVKEIMKILNI